MYSIQNAGYKFKQRANKVDGLRNVNFLIPQIDEYIWQGLIIWLETVCKELEYNQKRRDDIRELEVKNKVISVTKENDYYYAEIPSDYYRYLESYSICKTQSCPSKKIRNFIIQKDDIFSNDIMYESSYVFERINIDLSGNRIYIYVSDFEVSSIVLSYIRKPLKPANPKDHIAGFYNYADGTPAIQQDIEIDSTYQVEKIIDIAVLLAMRDVGNLTDFESQLNKILNISKI